MATRETQLTHDARLEELQPDKFNPDKLNDEPGQVGSHSGGQSGDSQGLSQTADAAEESVEELADTGQGFEADAVAGIEDAADHPERPVRTHEDFRRPDSIPSTE